MTLPDPVPLLRVTPAANLPLLGDENTARTVSLAGNLPCVNWFAYKAR